jgi:hypothetical protein
MISALVKTAVFLTLATVVLAQGRNIILLNTPDPTLVELCRVLRITWSGGTPPYTLSLEVVPTHKRIFDIVTNDTFYAWTDNTMELQLGLFITDINGIIGMSAPFSNNISGNNTSCLSGSTTAAAGTGTGTGARTSAPSGATGAATTGSSSNNGFSLPASSTGASTATATRTSGAQRAVIGIAATGVFGVVLAAFLVAA